MVGEAWAFIEFGVEISGLSLSQNILLLHFGKSFPREIFCVLKEKEIKLYGEYRTRRLVLEAWDALAGTQVAMSSVQLSVTRVPVEKVDTPAKIMPAAEDDPVPIQERASHLARSHT